MSEKWDPLLAIGVMMIWNLSMLLSYWWVTR